MEAAKKKHEAIETDTAAYEERVRALEDLAQELEKENYHDQKRITARKDNILRLWNYLQELLQSRRQRLETTLALQKLFQDMLHSIDWMDDIKVGPGTHPPCPWFPSGLNAGPALRVCLLRCPSSQSCLSQNGQTGSTVSGCICLLTSWLTGLQTSHQPRSPVSPVIKKSGVHSRTGANLQDPEEIDINQECGDSGPE